MSGSYPSRLRAGRGGGGLGATTVLAAKVAFASAALAAAASMVPQLVSCADAFLWKPYLFVTVHVIIFVIWKLSDSKHFDAAAHKDRWAPAPLHHHPAAAPPLLTEEVVLAAVKRKVEFAPSPAVVSAAPAEVYRVPSPVSRRHEDASAVLEEVFSPGSCGGESCVTTESEEDASSAAASAYAAATADASRTVASVPAPARQRAVLERGLSLPPPPATTSMAEYFNSADNDDGDGDDDLDATWNAIMQKTRPVTAPASSSSSPPAPRSTPPPSYPAPWPRAHEPSVGEAELSKRSEDFIKKIHHSFVRQQ